jgi:cell division protein FtsA
MLNNYICTIDIGSSKISAAVAQLKRNRILNIYFDSVPSKGVKRGIIIDSIGLVDSIGRVLKYLKVKSGVKIKFVYTNISGQDIVTKHSHAIIPLAERGNKVIALSDVQKANEQARILGSSLEEEIIHEIPTSYTIDSRNCVSAPVGLYSHRLEVDLYLICAKLSTVQNLARVINQSGYEIKGLFFSGLATSQAVFNGEYKDGLNILCDIGSDITELLLFKDGTLRDIKILPFGGDDLTLQLSNELKIPFDLAEDAKRSYGSVGDYSRINEEKEILVKKHNLYKPIKQRLVSQIITSKAKSFCDSLKDALEETVPCEEVNNFVATGRTLLLEGFLEMLENSLGISVKLGHIGNPDIIDWTHKDDAVSGQKYLTYLTCLGMIHKALQKSTPEIVSPAGPAKNIIFKTINKIKEVYEEYF